VVDAVQVTHPGQGVALVRLDTGPRNFSTFAANVALLEALDELREGDTRVVVIASGVDGVFAGHGWLPDVIATFTGGEPSGDPMAGARGFVELDTGPMVSIAAVDGEAWGHGAELAWACDLRVGSRRALFGQPEVNVGTCPGSGGTVRLARIAGEAVTLRLALDGRPIDGAEAFRLGLLHRLVEPGRVVDEALDWAAYLASRPPWALAANKRAIKGARDLPVREALRHEMGVFIEMLGRADTLRLVRAAQDRYDAGADTRQAFGIE
jgi:enoyl-CoA hydratase/carnithine racemase